MYYHIVDKKQDYIYNHSLRKEFIKINNKDKQLVQMNPGNSVNYKLTLSINDLKNIDSLIDDIQIFKI